MLVAEMAARMKAKLPSLRVTQRSTTGEISHRLIPRGCTSLQTETSSASDSDYSCSHDALEFDDNVLDLDSMHRVFEPSLTPANGSSLHEIAQKAAVASWSRIRAAMLKTTIECQAMPTNQKCLRCGVGDAVYRCLKCAP